MGPRAGLDWCGMSLPHRISIAGPSSCYAYYPIVAHVPEWGDHTAKHFKEISFYSPAWMCVA
jgi:hypothetical protein